jgi:hypothetical protein
MILLPSGRNVIVFGLITHIFFMSAYQLSFASQSQSAVHTIRRNFKETAQKIKCGICTASKEGFIFDPGSYPLRNLKGVATLTTNGISKL